MFSLEIIDPVRAIVIAGLTKVTEVLSTLGSAPISCVKNRIRNSSVLIISRAVAVTPKKPCPQKVG